MNIIQAIKHEDLFLPFFGSNGLETWKPWLTALRVIFGLPITSNYSKKLIRQCTGRDPKKLNPNGYQTALLLCGRRSGKSRISGVIGAYSAALAGLEKKLDPGEQGLVAVVSPTKKQGGNVRSYLRSLFDPPVLHQEIVSDYKHDYFQLKSGVRLEILASDYRSVRGFTLLGCVVDEVCFLGLEDSSRIRTDTQLIRSLEPALATTGGKLIAISSPYARSGWAYSTWKRHYGNDASKDVIVWRAPSKVMNSTLPQKVIDRALAEDLAAARSEYYAEWRDDISGFCPPELIEKLVVKGRIENLLEPGTKYHAFVDMSGGRNDSSCLCIAHREEKKIILDLVDNHPAPHNPFAVVDAMTRKLNEWGVRRVTGDQYSAEFAPTAFRDKGIAYAKAEKPKSGLYADMLPLLSAERIELLDSDRLIKQLCSLERRTRAGGKDIIDHPHGGHDDIANAAAGAIVHANAKRIVAGAGGF